VSLVILSLTFLASGTNFIRVARFLVVNHFMSSNKYKKIFVTDTVSFLLGIFFFYFFLSFFFFWSLSQK